MFSTTNLHPSRIEVVTVQIEIESQNIKESSTSDISEHNLAKYYQYAINSRPTSLENIYHYDDDKIELSPLNKPNKESDKKTNNKNEDTDHANPFSPNTVYIYNFICDELIEDFVKVRNQVVEYIYESPRLLRFVQQYCCIPFEDDNKSYSSNHANSPVETQPL